MHVQRNSHESLNYVNYTLFSVIILTIIRVRNCETRLVYTYSYILFHYRQCSVKHSLNFPTSTFTVKFNLLYDECDNIKDNDVTIYNQYTCIRPLSGHTLFGMWCFVLGFGH